MLAMSLTLGSAVAMSSSRLMLHFAPLRTLSDFVSNSRLFLLLMTQRGTLCLKLALIENLRSM
jgi:hypothetical protein